MDVSGIVRRSPWGLAVVALLGLSGCLAADRGWVREQLAPVQRRVVEVRDRVAVVEQQFGGLAPKVDRILMGAAIAWEQVAPFSHAAARPEVNGSPAVASMLGPRSRTSEDGQSVLDARDLSFRYRERGAPVLRGCSLRVDAGDRILLEGPSGGGKSTLASLLTGLRLPESGLLLLRGLDQQTLGSEGWRRRAVAAPQFHENHVLTAPFAFNLLMGRRWPAQPDDFQAAETVCRELGLGGLLDRMPAGMLQMVGETGWQLSHGERSRLYIARALLQGADLVILDESFAALDPETLHRSLRCVLDRTPTLLVIAHP
jgi:ATP-binding cassette subfamily B protein